MSWTLSISGHVEGNTDHQADVEREIGLELHKFVKTLHHLHAGVHTAILSGSVHHTEVPKPEAQYGPAAPDPEKGRPSA